MRYNQVSVGFDHILSIPWWTLNKFDLVSLWLNNHKEDAWLNTITNCDQLFRGVRDHECGEEDVDLLHDCHRDDLVLRVISPEAKRTKNSKEELLQKWIFEWHSLEIGGTNLKADRFLANFRVEEMLHNPRQLTVVLRHKLRILTNHGDDELTLWRHKILHGWLPIILIIDNWFSQNLEKLVNFVALGGCYK